LQGLFEIIELVLSPLQKKINKIKMPWLKKIFIFLLSILFISGVFAQQHPATEKIERLKKLLPLTKGVARIDCLNALSEEYWWPPRVLPDSISCWAKPAHDEAFEIGYAFGLATSNMHLGVAEIYRKNFLTAEKYLQLALQTFDSIHDEKGFGWCKLWLGQTLYAGNNFTDAIASLKTSLPILAKYGDGEGEGKAAAWLSFLYEARGDYDSSFYYCIKSLQIRQRMSDDVCVAGALNNMGHLYKNAGAYDDALDYYHQSMQYANSHGFNLYTTNWNNIHESIGTIYRLMDKPDSSLYYLNEALQIDPESQVTKVSFGETFLLEKQYDSALNIFLDPIKHFRRENDRWDLMRVLLDAGDAYEEKQNPKAALPYTVEGFSIAAKADAKPYMKQGYLTLSKIYNQFKKNDSAYFFMQKYVSLNDSLTNKQFLWRLTNYKKQTDFKKQIEQVTLLEKDNNIKEAKLKNASLLKWVLIIGILVLAMTSVIIYTSLALKRKNEKLKSEHEQALLKQSATELEMQALRAQMNPHFIFNCLSSINRFILKNETEAASDYLTKFSRLIRMVLTNSNKKFITLEDELDMLKLYLDMERLRFKESFNYSITFTNSIDASNVFVPPLLLQPFVENAIWHGLMHKQGQGHLEIVLSVEDKTLTCMITDNGIGRSKSAMLKNTSGEKQKSMGLYITRERLALLNKDIDEQTYFNFEDITDNEGNSSGTRVILKMRYKDLMEVTV
jgi:tetratricopeptide (TPR) repeat protein